MAKIKAPKNYAEELLQKREFWTKIISEWQQNPISPRQFCKSRGIVKEQFYYWRRKVIDNFSDTTAISGDFIEMSVPNNSPNIAATETIKPTASNEHIISIEVQTQNGAKFIIKLPSSIVANIISQLGGIAC